MNTELAHQKKGIIEQRLQSSDRLYHLSHKTVCGKGMKKGEAKISWQSWGKFYEGNGFPHRS